jgi:hypothetical protein|mmetsp:Transcript_77792/g.121421  ORF Transcript_77792/g.121421 Transcript_77792/m.121421 type:complete len:93 (-) Transcript_77792:309-587(-)
MPTDKNVEPCQHVFVTRRLVEGGKSAPSLQCFKHTLAIVDDAITPTPRCSLLRQRAASHGWMGFHCACKPKAYALLLVQCVKDLSTKDVEVA